MSVQWLGFLGTALVVTAYVPQISHLVKARCAGGLSLWAQLVWTLSAALLFTYAATTGDPVFIVLQAYQLVALSSILVVAIRHRGRGCATHCGAPPDQDRPRTVLPGHIPVPLHGPSRSALAQAGVARGDLARSESP